LGTGTTLIDPDVLAQLQTKINRNHGTDDNGAFRWWEGPVKKSTAGKRGVYVCCVDSASGHGRDHAVAMWFRVDCRPFVHVATFRSNWVDPFTFPGIIKRFGDIYNKSPVFPESNDPQVGDTLHKMGWPIVFTSKDVMTGNIVATFDPVPGAIIGLRSTSQTKNVATTMLKTLVERQELISVDGVFIDELSRYSWIENGKGTGGKWGAIRGNDDTISAALLFALLVHSPGFESNIQRRVLGAELYNENEEPFCIVSDGLEIRGGTPSPPIKHPLGWLIGDWIQEAIDRRALEEEDDDMDDEWQSGGPTYRTGQGPPPGNGGGQLGRW
jgi:hypothetical protein